MKVRDLSPAESEFCKEHLYVGSPAEKAYRDVLVDLLSEYQSSGTSSRTRDLAAVQRFADTLWTSVQPVVGITSLKLFRVLALRLCLVDHRCFSLHSSAKLSAFPFLDLDTEC